MTPEQHREVRESLGALALGHLPPAEAARLERHVVGCADCRRELAEVAPLGARLRALDWSRASDETAPPPDLAAHVMAGVRREVERAAARGRMQRLTVAVAAAAAVVAIGGIGAVAGRSSTPGVAAAPKIPFEPVAVRTAVPGIDASAGVVPHTWGVEIKLKAAGFEQGAAYAVFVTTADGKRRSAGAFVGTGANPMNCNLNSDVLRPDAAAFAVVDAGGRTVLSATLPTTG